LFNAVKMGLDGCNPRVAETHRSLQHLHSVGALPAHVSKTTMVTRRKPPPHLPPTAYRPLTPQSPVAPNPTFPCRRGRRRSQESPAHLGLQCVVRCVHYGLGRVQPKVRRNSQVSAAPGKVPRTSDYSALFDEFDMGLDGCNPRFAETHRSLLHPGKSRHRTRSLPTALRAGHCEARKAGIVGERLDGVPGNHPSPEIVFSHCPPPDAWEGNNAGCSTTRVRRRGGRAGRRG